MKSAMMVVIFLHGASAFSQHGVQLSNSCCSQRLAIRSVMQKNHQSLQPSPPNLLQEQRAPLPKNKQLSAMPLEKIEMGERLRAYRELYRRPLVDVKHIKDPGLVMALAEPSWTCLFDMPATLSEVNKIGVANQVCYIA